MEQKFCEFATQCGLVQIGYAGRDQSVMGVLEELLKQERTFPHGIYWGVRRSSDIPERVQRLAQKHPKRFNLFACPDFDLFMARLMGRRPAQLGSFCQTAIFCYGLFGDTQVTEQEA